MLRNIDIKYITYKLSNAYELPYCILYIYTTIISYHNKYIT